MKCILVSRSSCLPSVLLLCKSEIFWIQFPSVITKKFLPPNILVETSDSSLSPSLTAVTGLRTPNSGSHVLLYTFIRIRTKVDWYNCKGKGSPYTGY